MLHWLKRNERGQSLVEVSVVSALLIMIVVVVFEVGVVFSSYIALLNASREGAIFASSHPQVLSVAAANRPTDPRYQEYLGRVKAEARLSVVTDDCATHPSPPCLTVLPPQFRAGWISGDAVTVTVSYSCTTFTSGLQLPFFGRFGRPHYWPISAWTVAPIQ